jgi:hypothetical protein
MVFVRSKGPSTLVTTGALSLPAITYHGRMKVRLCSWNAFIAVLALAMTAALGTGWLWATPASCTVPKPASDEAA